MPSEPSLCRRLGREPWTVGGFTTTGAANTAGWPSSIASGNVKDGAKNKFPVHYSSQYRTRSKDARINCLKRETLTTAPTRKIGSEPRTKYRSQRGHWLLYKTIESMFGLTSENASSPI